MNKKLVSRATFSFILLMVSIHDVWGQNSWTRMYGGSNSDYSQSIKSTRDGGMLITGVTNTRENILGQKSNDGDFEGLWRGKEDVYVMKLDGYGRIIWTTMIGGTWWERSFAITTTSDDKVLVTGYTDINLGSGVPYEGDFSNTGKGLKDIFVMKLDRDGRKIWEKVIGGNCDDISVSITTAPNGDYLISGATGSDYGDFKGLNKNPFNTCQTDVFVIRINANGESLWTKVIGGPDKGEYCKSMTTTSNGEIVITGGTESNRGDFEGLNKGRIDIFVTKLNMDGQMLWTKVLGGALDDNGHSLVSTPDGGVVVIGETNSMDGDFEGMNTGAYVPMVFVIKLDKDGSVSWKRTFRSWGLNRSDFSTTQLSITTSSDEKLIVAGSTLSNEGVFEGMNKGPGFTDVFIMKIDHDGRILWTRMYGGQSGDFANSVDVSTDGGIIITGETVSTDGVFNGNRKGGYDIFVMKLDSNGNLNPSTSVTDNTSITPSLLVTPNPISTSSTVMCSIGTPTSVRIELLNTLGESVSVLHDGFMESGEHRVPLGVSSVSSGVYYVRMTSEGTVNSSQVVVLK